MIKLFPTPREPLSIGLTYFDRGGQAAQSLSAYLADTAASPIQPATHHHQHQWILDDDRRGIYQRLGAPVSHASERPLHSLTL